MRCCESHLVGVCCDPDDCGPCCPQCPTCPTLSRQRGEDYDGPPATPHRPDPTEPT